MAQVSAVPSAGISFHLSRSHRVLKRTRDVLNPRHRKEVLVCRADQQPKNPESASDPRAVRRAMLALGSAVALVLKEVLINQRVQFEIF